MPELLPGAAELLGTFWELSTDRQLGFGVIGPLPAASIDRYCLTAGFDEEEEVSFRGAMRAMDKVFREIIDSRAAENTSDSSTVTGKPRRDNIQTRPMSPNLFDALFLPK